MQNICVDFWVWGPCGPCLITNTVQDMLKILVMILISIIIINVNTNEVDGTKEMKTSQSKYYLIKTEDTKV